MIDPATLAEWEENVRWLGFVDSGLLKAAITEIRRLQDSSSILADQREELNMRLAAHRAVIREFGDAIDMALQGALSKEEYKRLQVIPLVVAAREGT